MAAPCRCLASTSKRLLSTTARARDQRGSSGKSYAQGVRTYDPDNLLEARNQLPLLHDDLPTRAFREYDLDAEMLHYARLVEWQLPELGQKYGQTSLYAPGPSNVVCSSRTEWAFEPNHAGHHVARIEVAADALLERLSSDAARHKFLLLLGRRYRIHERVVRIKGDLFPAYAQNLKWCSDQLDETLRRAEIEPEAMAEIPLDDRGQPPPRPTLASFPADWLKGRDAQRRVQLAKLARSRPPVEPARTRPTRLLAEVPPADQQATAQ